MSVDLARLGKHAHAVDLVDIDIGEIDFYQSLSASTREELRTQDPAPRYDRKSGILRFRRVPIYVAERIGALTRG